MFDSKKKNKSVKGREKLMASDGQDDGTRCGDRILNEEIQGIRLSRDKLHHHVDTNIVFVSHGLSQQARECS